MKFSVGPVVMVSLSGSSSSSYPALSLTAYEDPESNDDLKAGDDSQQESTSLPRKRRRYSCIFRKKHSKTFKPLSSYFGPIRETAVIEVEVNMRCG